ncbi:MAG TPA: DinB family protein [Vicinamibacterales bacterium]|nr:DinB family protein [Vicinamibacterales bacterium]
MDPQIEGYLLQLLSLTQDLPGVAGRLSPSQFNWRPSPERWSIGQCVEHLNITTERYVPVLRTAIATARATGALAPGPFALGFFERWFMNVLEPPVRRFRATAPRAFVATQPLVPDETLARWDRFHEDFADCIRSAEGLDLRRIKVRSQFGPVSFSLGGTFSILLAHERRHVWQAREVRNDRGFPVG